MLESSYYMDMFTMIGQRVKFNWTLAKNGSNAYRANDSQRLYLGITFASRFSIFFHIVMLKPNSEQLVEILISSCGLSKTFFFHSKMQANSATIDNKFLNGNLQVSWTGGPKQIIVASPKISERAWFMRGLRYGSGAHSVNFWLQT